jgi:hypothetical protein
MVGGTKIVPGSVVVTNVVGRKIGVRIFVLRKYSRTLHGFPTLVRR